MCESIKEFLVVRAGLVVLSSNIVASQILHSFKNFWKLPLGVLITRHWELACYRKQTWLFTRGCSSYMQSSQQGGRLNMIITVLGEMVFTDILLCLVLVLWYAMCLCLCFYICVFSSLYVCAFLFVFVVCVILPVGLHLSVSICASLCFLFVFLPMYLCMYNCVRVFCAGVITKHLQGVNF